MTTRKDADGQPSERTKELRTQLEAMQEIKISVYTVVDAFIKRRADLPTRIFTELANLANTYAEETTRLYWELQREEGKDFERNFSHEFAKDEERRKHEQENIDEWINALGHMIEENEELL